MVDFIRNIFNPEQHPQYSIVALLDAEHDRFIRTLWREMESEFGITIPFENPLPHMTHLVFGDIKQKPLQEALERFAEDESPYTIRTAGIGIFTGKRNAVYVSAVRTPNLSAIQTSLISAVASSVDDLAETHLINNWMPHITLAMGLSGENGDLLGAIVKRLAHRNFAWEFKVTRLGLLEWNAQAADAARFVVDLTDKSS